MHEVARQPSARWSLEIDLFCPNGFEWHYKFTREKNNWHMLCRERRKISRTVLLVNCHDVTGRFFDRGISPKTGRKGPLKWHDQPGKNGRLLESLTIREQYILMREVAQQPSARWSLEVDLFLFLSLSKKIKDVNTLWAEPPPVFFLIEEEKSKLCLNRVKPCKSPNPNLWTI